MGKKNVEPSIEDTIKLVDEDRAAIREAAATWATEEYRLGNTQLSDETLRFIYVMCHPLTGRSVQEWADIAGVDRKCFYRYKDRPAWQAAVDKLRSTYRNRQLNAADRVIERLLESDDPKVQLAAARTIYEREGQFIQRVETTRVEKPAEQRNFERAMQERIKGKQEPKQLN